MNQPAVAPAVDESRRRRRNRVIVLAVVGGIVVLGAGSFAVFSRVASFVHNATLKPWALLQEAKAAVQTEPGAATFYKAHPGLAGRFPTPESFVQASRPWPPKLAVLPATPPDFWTMLKSGGGDISITTSGSESKFSLKGFRGVSVELSLEKDQLVDLQVE
jgi:hypothetical protein